MMQPVTAISTQSGLHESADPLDRLASLGDESGVVMPDVRHARPFFELHFAAGLAQADRPFARGATYAVGSVGNR